MWDQYDYKFYERKRDDANEKLEVYITKITELNSKLEDIKNTIEQYINKK